MKTYIHTDKEVNGKTYLVDASGKTLGRIATRIATTLIGKHKPTFSYDKFSGDNVVVINAEKVVVSGKKKSDKVYTHYTGYPGGLRSYNYEDLQEKKPEEIVIRAVKRMLPKNLLGREMLRRLRVYTGDKHNQQAQKPEPLQV